MDYDMVSDFEVDTGIDFAELIFSDFDDEDEVPSCPVPQQRTWQLT